VPTQYLFIIGHIGVGAGIIWRSKGYFAQNSPSLPEKFLFDNLSPYKSSVVVGKLSFLL